MKLPLELYDKGTILWVNFPYEYCGYLNDKDLEEVLVRFNKAVKDKNYHYIIKNRAKAHGTANCKPCVFFLRPR